ncbi:LacI family repressor for deo operon, udp, cdd, tsx, nupC, and nupG [Gracilibacillus halotolerans]|uniref:LacI family repressor for deo operon, udp, cdd, tsx, nupC, and nupG n=1 Tax=Gracilibacillus halotolerans TaxID=74386 RepID=A0A841RPL6_9BACI|nr:LacI family repressor for deo operon, udp, cdd, tsx, nupC, and nupG [Gracilibacillus halotolerans]
MLRGIEYVAVENGYQVLLGDTENDEDSEASYTEILKQRLADGMILLTARMKEEKLVEMAKSYPIVLGCEYYENESIPSVTIDNISSARKLTDHLINLGHTRIGHITGPMNVILSKDRLKGYLQALSTKQIESQSLLIQEGDFTYDSGYKQMIKLLSLENPPTAVFAASDQMAMGAIKAAKSRNYRVPEDVVVVGFDNIEMSSIFEPSITTIAQPKFSLGKKAMELLLNIIDSNNSLIQKQYVLNDELIIRESCGANYEKH